MQSIGKLRGAASMVTLAFSAACGAEPELPNVDPNVDVSFPGPALDSG